jgi:PHD/YefM family antitoxin component YafN of YafNO toxin-antitoxin module
MDATYLLKADELDEQFLTSDETNYLLRSPANRRHLQEALADVEAGRNIVAPECFP